MLLFWKFSYCLLTGQPLIVEALMNEACVCHRPPPHRIHKSYVFIMSNNNFDSTLWVSQNFDITPNFEEKI